MSNDVVSIDYPSIADYMSANCPIAFKMFHEPWSFNFYKLCSIIENICKESGSNYQEVVFFSRKESYAFPTSEVSNFLVRENRIIVETTFLNLYGVNQVLPEYFGNCVINNEIGSGVLKSFLDILHNRITHLYYEEWKHFKLYYFDTHAKFLDSLNLCRKIFFQFEVDFRNLQVFFTKKKISPNLIRGVLKYYFVNHDIQIKCFERKEFEIENNFYLSNTLISNESPRVLGNKLYSTNYDFKAFIKVESLIEYMMFLKDDNFKHSLLCMFKALLDGVYHIKIYLVLNHVNKNYSSLGKEAIILGKNSFMGPISNQIFILFGNI